MTSLLLDLDLVDPPLVATALERRVEKYAHHLFGDSQAYHSRADAQHVGVVVATRHLGREGVVAQGGTHPRMAVGGHGHADAGAADQHTRRGLAANHRVGDTRGQSPGSRPRRCRGCPDPASRARRTNHLERALLRSTPAWSEAMTIM